MKGLEAFGKANYLKAVICTVEPDIAVCTEFRKDHWVRRVIPGRLRPCLQDWENGTWAALSPSSRRFIVAYFSRVMRIVDVKDAQSPLPIAASKQPRIFLMVHAASVATVSKG